MQEMKKGFFLIEYSYTSVVCSIGVAIEETELVLARD